MRNNAKLSSGEAVYCSAFVISVLTSNTSIIGLPPIETIFNLAPRNSGVSSSTKVNSNVQETHLPKTPMGHSNVVVFESLEILLIMKG